MSSHLHENLVGLSTDSDFNKYPALTASSSQWQAQVQAKIQGDECGKQRKSSSSHTPVNEQSFPDRVEQLSEHQLATIERKVLLEMMATQKYTPKQKAEVKRKRRLFKNRISAKGAIQKKKAATLSLTALSSHLAKTVDELQKQNRELQADNHTLKQGLFTAQKIAAAREQEKARYENKILELTEKLRELDPNATLSD